MNVFVAVVAGLFAWSSVALGAPVYTDDDPLPPEEAPPSVEPPAPAPEPSEQSEQIAAPPLAEQPSDDADRGSLTDEPAPPSTEPLRPAPPLRPARPPRTAPASPKARMSINPRAGLRGRIDDEDGDGRLEKKEDSVLGGRHFRIRTGRGAVHVWVPPNYDRETAGTVVYVHGYYTDADGAWREHDLPRQFKASNQNAMSIVPAAPPDNGEEVRWPALKDLRKAVTRANISLPDGPIVVMGHSGAFRTVMQWVDHRLIDKIILLDALYAGEAAFDEFIASGKRADNHRMIVVAASTAEESESFARRYKFAVARERMPSGTGGFTRRERGAKLLYIRSQFDHMAIVTGGKVIPTLLRMTPLKSL